MEDIINFFKDRKNLINILTFGILILGLPVGIQLARTQQILFSKAAQAAVELVEGNCVVTRNSKLVATCEKVAIKLVAPWPAPPQANSPAQNRVSEVNMSFVKTAYAEGSECYSDFECPVGESCINNVCSAPPASCTPNWQETSRNCISCNTARVLLNDGCGNTDIRDVSTFDCRDSSACQEVIPTATPQPQCQPNWQQTSRTCISCNTATVCRDDGCGNSTCFDDTQASECVSEGCWGLPTAVPTQCSAIPADQICQGHVFDSCGETLHGLRDCNVGTFCYTPDNCNADLTCSPASTCISAGGSGGTGGGTGGNPTPTPNLCAFFTTVCHDDQGNAGTKSCLNGDYYSDTGTCYIGAGTICDEGCSVISATSTPTPPPAGGTPCGTVYCNSNQTCLTDPADGNTACFNNTPTPGGIGGVMCDSSHISGQSWPGFCTQAGQRIIFTCESNGTISTLTRDDSSCSVGTPFPTTASGGSGGSTGGINPTPTPRSGGTGGQTNPTPVPTRPVGAGGTRCGPDICTGSQVCVRDQFSGELGCQVPTPTRPIGGATIPVATPTTRPTAIPIATATVGPLTPTGPNCYVGAAGNVTSVQANCVIGMRSDILPFYQSNNWCIQSTNYPGIVNNWYNAVADAVGKAQVASCFGGSLSGTPGPSVSANPTNAPSPTPVPTYTVAFRVGEESGSYGDWFSYTQEPVVFNYQFKNTNPGKKFIFAQYKDNLGNLSREYSTNIDFVGGDPVMSSLDCKVDLTGSGLAITLAGANFGVDEGTISANNSAAEINSWKADSVVARLANPGFSNNQNGQKYRVILTRKDGQTVAQDCRVGTATIALGAKYFCRAPSAQTTQNVKATLIENVPSAKPVRETISIDQEGNIQGLKSVIQEGHSYSLGIKVPRALRKAVTFLGSAGTTILPNFNIPVGDIYPSGDGDNAINSNDYAELVREWGTKFSAGSRPGDFNLDGAVNSFDYACMRDNINKSADEEPVTPLVVQTTSPAVTVSPTTPPSKTTPTPTCSSRPACLDATPPCLPPIPPGGWCGATPTPLPDMTSCTTDNDCDCGTNVINNQCAVGKKQYIDTSKQCPDFCTGIDGRQTVKCVNQVCKVVPRS